MSSGFFAINILLHDTILKHANRGQYIKGVFVAGIDTIENQTNNNLLPSRSPLPPELRFFQVNNVTDILHHSVKSSSREHFVFVVVSNGKQQFCVSVIHSWSQIVSVLERKVVWITCRRSVCMRYPN